MAYLGDKRDLAIMLRYLFLLAPHAVACERNWSSQGFIINEHRTRLSTSRSSKLVAIYFNLRSLEQCDQSTRARPPAAQPAAEGFPHPNESWQPFSNWGASAHGSFDGMHGDEMDTVVEGEGDVDDGEVGDDDDDVSPAAIIDWPEADARAAEILPPQAGPLGHAAVASGARLAVWFAGEYCAWYEGVVVKVDRRRKLPVLGKFSDGETYLGEAYLALTTETYGATGGKQWVLLARGTGAGSDDAPVIVDPLTSESDASDVDV